MAKATAQNTKVVLGKRKKGKAVKRPNKHTSNKPSRGQG